MLYSKASAVYIGIETKRSAGTTRSMEKTGSASTAYVLQLKEASRRNWRLMNDYKLGLTVLLLLLQNTDKQKKTSH